MIRFILCIGFLFLFLVFSTPLMGLTWLLGKIGLKKVADPMSLAIVNWAFRIVRRLAGTNLIVLGRENIPTEQACVFMGNHRGIFDVILSYPQVIRSTGYLSKKELEKVPLLSVWMRRLYCQFLDRKDIKAGLNTILKCIDLVKEGVSICVFPEGTRNKVPDTFLPFHEASFKIATKTGAPIVPMTILGTGEMMDDHMPRIKKGTVVIHYGTPIYPKDLSKEELKTIGAYTQSVIEKTYGELKETYYS